MLHRTPLSHSLCDFVLCFSLDSFWACASRHGDKISCHDAELVEEDFFGREREMELHFWMMQSAFFQKSIHYSPVSWLYGFSCLFIYFFFFCQECLGNLGEVYFNRPSGEYEIVYYATFSYMFILKAC